MPGMSQDEQSEHISDHQGPRQLYTRIESDPSILHGKPVIQGTRLSVEVLLESIAHGDTFDEVLTDYPFLSREDITAALEYAAHLTATVPDAERAAS